MNDEVRAARIRYLEDEIVWVSERLHDSQEYEQIIRLEDKRDTLWKELDALRGLPMDHPT